MSTVAPDVDPQRLNALLWRYRPLLDRFEFLLEMQLNVAASGRDDWLHHVTDLLEELAVQLNQLDLEREVALGAGATVSEVAARSPEPWSSILGEQVAHFQATTARVERLRRRNQQMFEASTAGLSRLFDGLAEAAGHGAMERGDSYDGEGRRRTSGTGSLLFDGRA